MTVFERAVLGIAGVFAATCTYFGLTRRTMVSLLCSAGRGSFRFSGSVVVFA
jgi:hypothetical protein